MKNVALITGASSGIGKELALIHAKNGGDLVLVARREDLLYKLKKQIEDRYNVKVFILVSDLSIQGKAQELYDEVQKLGLEIEYLINNAGFGLVGEFSKLSLARQTQMINLNILALTELTHLFLPEMIKRDSGRILNVSSTASLVPGPLQAVYFASKAYVTSFSNALSEELRNTNVSVTNLMPAATKTEFGSISGMDKTKSYDKITSAYDVALAGYSGMLDKKIDVIIGLSCLNKVLTKISPLLPKKFLLKEVRKTQEIKSA